MSEREQLRLFSSLPKDQVQRVFNQGECDIEPQFLGFIDIYKYLSKMIPLHWRVIDLGCAYAPQAFYFAKHKAYIGVDFSVKERFQAPNTVHYFMSIREFLETEEARLDLDTTFAICSYVPPWEADNMALTRMRFKNVFTYYPAGTMELEAIARRMNRLNMRKVITPALSESQST